MTLPSDVWGLKRVGTNAAACPDQRRKYKHPRRGAMKQGSGVVFTAFDRVWPLVGLTLALLAIVWWMTLLGHLAITLL